MGGVVKPRLGLEKLTHWKQPQTLPYNNNPEIYPQCIQLKSIWESQKRVFKLNYRYMLKIAMIKYNCFAWVLIDNFFVIFGLLGQPVSHFGFCHPIPQRSYLHLFHILINIHMVAHSSTGWIKKSGSPLNIFIVMICSADRKILFYTIINSNTFAHSFIPDSLSKWFWIA